MFKKTWSNAATAIIPATCSLVSASHKSVAMKEVQLTFWFPFIALSGTVNCFSLQLGWLRPAWLLEAYFDFACDAGETTVAGSSWIDHVASGGHRYNVLLVEFVNILSI